MPKSSSVTVKPACFRSRITRRAAEVSRTSAVSVSSTSSRAGGTPCSAQQGQQLRHQRLVLDLLWRHVHRPRASAPAGPAARRRRCAQHRQRQRADQARVLGQRDELRRRQQPALRVLPPRQQLHRLHAAAGQLDDGLEVRHELAAVEAVPHGLFQRGTFGHQLVEADVVEAQAAAALGLGAVERRVGLAQQLVGIAAVFREAGDADRRADGHAERSDLHRLAHRAHHAFGQMMGCRRLHVVADEHDELVAAVARAGLAAAQDLAQAPRHFLQHAGRRSGGRGGR